MRLFGTWYRELHLRLATHAAIFTASALLTLFVGGAVKLAEVSVHPARVTIPKVCPCLAFTTCESVMVGDQRAWLYHPRQSNGSAIILLHGIGGSRVDLVSLGNLFLRHSYEVLEPDLRGHGESGGVTTYGVLEAGDLHDWADWLFNTQHIQRLYGFGASLGGSALLQSLNVEHRYRAIVAESAFDTFPDIARERLHRQAPEGLKWLSAPLAGIAMTWVRLRYGNDLTLSSPLEAIRHTRTPVLLIHGLDDNLTDPDNSRRLAAADPAAELWLVPHSHHADARATTGAEFDAKLLSFFEQHQ